MLDEFALILFISCVMLYAILLLFSYKKRKPSQFNIIKLIYHDWVDQRLKQKDPIVSVQALRNFIMGNSTFVSALFILLGILVALFNISSEETIFSLPGITIGFVQIAVNMIVIIFSLFNFILSIRFITRLSLLITGNPQDHTLGKITGMQAVKKTFLSAQNHWMFGVRGLFYLIATLIWFIHTLFFIIGTILVTIYLIAFQDVWTISKKK